MHDIYKQLGKRIKELRNEHDIPQARLAEALGYESRVTISQIENGNYNVSVLTLKKVSDFFQVPISELIDDEYITESKS